MSSLARTVLIVALATYLWQRWRTPAPISRDTAASSYDYVVVGGGSAGSVVAARLSEDPEVTVLLLEAGDDDAKFDDIRVPLKAFSLWHNERVDWMYTTTPQEHACLSMEGRQCAWPTAKVLGGGSSVNGMIYMRGHPKDFDLWAQDGCEGWDYKSVLPYFRKSENNLNPTMAKSSYHGTSGPQVVADCNTSYSGSNVLLETFLESGRELGYVVGDLNGADSIGTVMQNQVHVINGERQSVSDAFLRPVTSRPNLHILTNSHVTKVVIDDLHATGAEYQHGGTKHYVAATREVIVSAGTVSSAQLLMLSGVGPREHLEALGIPVIADLPVGHNLQDHLLLPVLQFTVDQPVTVLQETTESLSESLKYKLFRQGVLTSPILTHGHAMERSLYQRRDHDVPYIKLNLVGQLIGSSEEALMQYTMRLRQNIEVEKQHLGGCEGQHGFHLFPVLLQPRSKGSIRLKSADPFDHPMIDPQYLSDPLDIKVLIDGIRMAQTVASTKAFEKLGTMPRGRVHPGCWDLEYDSDQYWECVLRQAATTEFHPSGTCRMGAESDPRAVVDPSLRVRGVQGLRVIDCSVMPHIVSANTNAATVMIAEKGADLMKQQRGTGD